MPNCEYCQKPIERRFKCWTKRLRYCSKLCCGKAISKEEIKEPTLKFCVGCGAELKRSYGEGLKRWNRRRLCSNACMSGSNASNWRGGRAMRLDRLKDRNGYIRVFTGKNRREFEHRIIAEKMLGRPLLRTEVVHHRNGDKADNREDNLQICTNAEHRRIHWEMSMAYAKEHFGEPFDSMRMVSSC